MAAEPSYSCIFPDGYDLDRLAYFFCYESAAELPVPAHEALGERLREWQQLWDAGAHPSLRFKASDHVAMVFDYRCPDRPSKLVLRGFLAAAFLALDDRPCSASSIAKATLCDERSAKDALSDLVDAGLVLQENDLYLSLVLPDRGHVAN